MSIPWHYRFYRKFVLLYADITNCLTNLLRKGTEFKWSEQCNNTFKTLKEELCKMPSLQYPDPNKPFKLFTDASNHSYLGILHQAQDKESDHLILIAYFSGSFNCTQQLSNVTQKECYAVYKSINKFTFYLYCDHKPLAPFLMTGMKSQTMDRLALKLKQYNVKFKHVAGKESIVADTISHLKAVNLYEEPEDHEVSRTPESIDDIIKNLILEIHPHQSSSSVNILFNLDSLVAQQKTDRFCKNKAKCIHHHQRSDFELDDKEYSGNCMTTSHLGINNIHTKVPN